MTKTDNLKMPIGNAGIIIERFGGIRPMAKKMDVAVTTIQGWKKRDSIPAARRAELVNAAAAHGIDLSDMLDNVETPLPPAAKKPKASPPVIDASVKERTKESSIIPAPTEPDSSETLQRVLVETEKSAVAKSAWVSVVLILLAVAAIVLLYWPRAPLNGPDPRLSALEQNVDGLRTDVETVRSEQSFLSTLIPADLDERIAGIQQQAEAARSTVNAALEKAGEISDDMFGQNAGSLDERLSRLESHMAGLPGSQNMHMLLERFRSLGNSLAGQEQLSQAMTELGALMEGVSAQAPSDASAPVSGLQENLGEILANARAHSPALGVTFEGVPDEDLKAAAMLLGMNQFRSTLNRSATPFQNDFKVLKGMIGESDPELNAALDRLAPHAEQGVLTPARLSEEFKGLAGEAVVASLRGEDVSLMERAKARLGTLLQVRKDGDLVSGTDTQAVVDQAETFLEQGQIDRAIAELQTLQGPAAEVTAPWVEKARAAAEAEKVKTLLDRHLTAAATSPPPPGG
ncbi:MAG: hypothetical protein K9G62_05970 [Alphaproteobacteria bacterium]|nr:hypothetical protein [Alphaproteobacteria bacterium]